MPPEGIREIRDEDGDVIARVWEENPGTMMQCLKCQLADGPRELIEYPATWRKLSDRKLFALCKTGEKR
ncbi:MAG: hypothetical protein JNJ80_26070 [Gemmatimonadetes bacterium]|nr:hypothetical protein [Gemmatimonadota bacterium]MCC7132828.1 hypothetical protein [Gemmatimonadales bacterium]